MSLFATDFGAGGFVACCGLAAFLAVLALSLLGIRWGDRLRKRDSARARRAGRVLVAVCCLMPFLAYFGPAHVVRLTTGNYPLTRYPNDVIQEGMTRDEVTALLGTPHDRYARDGEERWYYYIGSLGASYFGVAFGPNGRVTHTWGD